VTELHQEPVTLLAQRIVHQPLRTADRVRPALVLLVPAREPLECLQVEARETVPFVRQPLVIAAFEELAAVRLDGFLEAPLGKRPLELLDVEPQRDVRAPLKRPRPDVDQAVGFGQRTPEVVEHLAEVRLGLALRRIGPEHEGQALTRLRRVAVEQHVREQRLRATGVQRRNLPLSEAEVHGPEEPRA
jgi:hypothetical protein